jgi:hypothetical protein
MESHEPQEEQGMLGMSDDDTDDQPTPDYDDPVPFTMKHHRAVRSLYTQLASAYYGGKAGNCSA